MFIGRGLVGAAIGSKHKTRLIGIFQWDLAEHAAAGQIAAQVTQDPLQGLVVIRFARIARLQAQIALLQTV